MSQVNLDESEITETANLLDSLSAETSYGNYFNAADWLLLCRLVSGVEVTEDTSMLEARIINSSTYTPGTGFKSLAVPRLETWAYRYPLCKPTILSIIGYIKGVLSNQVFEHRRF